MDDVSCLKVFNCYNKPEEKSMAPGAIFQQHVGRKTKIDVATFVLGRKEIALKLSAASWFSRNYSGSEQQAHHSSWKEKPFSNGWPCCRQQA
jgi:hypothetical protein